MLVRFLNPNPGGEAVMLAFYSIQWFFIRQTPAKFGIPNSPQSPDIGQNSDVSISNLRISGQLLINENCHNSGNNSNIQMKLRPITKLDKRNTATLKKVNYDDLSTNCDFFVIFLIYDQLGSNQKPDSGLMLRNTYIFINNNLLAYKI